MDWAMDFLEEHPSETLIVELKPETRDEDKYNDIIYTRLRNIMREFSYEVNPSTGKTFLYMEQDLSFSDIDKMYEYSSFDVKSYEEAHIGEDFDYEVVLTDLPEIYTASEGVWDDDMFRITCKLKTDSKYFKGHSLSLNGDIGVNFYVDLTEEEAQTAKVSCSWFNKELRDLTPVYNQATGLYKITCPVAAAEMTYDVTAVLSINGVEKETNIYSAFKYAVFIYLDKSWKQSYIDSMTSSLGSVQAAEEKYHNLLLLVASMCDYGAMAQKCFDRNIDHLSNGGKKIFANSGINADSIKSVPSNMHEDLDAYGLEYQYSSVVCLSGNALKHYYKITDQDKFDAIKDTITLDGETVQPVKNGNMIYFMKKDIPAVMLDHQYELTIGQSSYLYSVIDYMKLLMNSGLEEKYTDLGKSVYQYNKAAHNYFD